MANSLFSKPRYSNNSGRNGFDVSQRRVFTMPCGMILPLWSDYSIAGDKYTLNSSTFIRTEAVETAAFIQLRYIVDWFFVPYEQLYMFWNEFYNQTQDVGTSFIDTTAASNSVDYSWPKGDLVPVIRSFRDSTSFFHSKNSEKVTLTCDEFGVPYAWNFRRLYDMFGFGSLSTLLYYDTNDDYHFYSLCIKALAYHRIFYSYFNNSVFFKHDNSLYNVDKYHGSDLSKDLVSQLFSKIHYRPYPIDYFTNIQPAPVFNSSFVNSVFPSNTAPISRDSVAIRPVAGRSLAVDNYDSTTSKVVDILGNVDPSVGGKHGSFLNLNLNDSSLIGAGDIRTLFALDKLYRITASAGSHYEDQTYAHLGFKVPEGIHKDAYHIGSQVTDININEVVATASTGAEGAGSTIGDIAGKGFGQTSGQSDIHFTAPCDGIMMAVCSIVPKPMYASRGSEVSNRIIDAFDFYKPEFDNIGMVPFYDAFFWNHNLKTENSKKLDGWTYRYYDWKSKFDVVNESIWDTNKAAWAGYKQSLIDIPFNSTGYDLYPTLNSIFFCAPQYTNNVFEYDFPHFGLNGFGKQPIFDFESADYRTWSQSFLDSNRVYSGDNFIINSSVKAFKTSIMSVHSLPKLY